MNSDRIVVIGGGLAGLCAALRIAREGRNVTLLERAGAIGGRATSQREAGGLLNQGPHALYLGGRAVRVFREMGVSWRGTSARSPYFFAETEETEKAALPASPVSLLTTNLLTFAGKMQLISRLATMGRGKGLESTTAADWIERLGDPSARRLLTALLRVTSYVGDPSQLSAAAAIRQLRLATEAGVVYLDNGWQSLVDSFASQAYEAGVVVRTGAAPSAVERTRAGFRVHVDGESLEANAVVLAVGPNVARSLVPTSSALALEAAEAVPVRAACLDVVLKTLPNPHHHFTLGLGGANYLSVHSAFARLGLSSEAVIHVARYLTDRDGDPVQVRCELEAVLDRAQPGWREALLHARYLPKMIVSNALPLASRGGRRAPVAVADMPGLFVAGDWVGSEGMLLDAAIASACAASDGVLAHDGAMKAVA